MSIALEQLMGQQIPDRAKFMRKNVSNYLNDRMDPSTLGGVSHPDPVIIERTRKLLGNKFEDAVKFVHEDVPTAAANGRTAIPGNVNIFGPLIIDSMEKFNGLGTSIREISEGFRNPTLTSYAEIEAPSNRVFQDKIITGIRGLPLSENAHLIVGKVGPHYIGLSYREPKPITPSMKLEPSEDYLP